MGMDVAELTTALAKNGVVSVAAQGGFHDLLTGGGAGGQHEEKYFKVLVEKSPTSEDFNKTGSKMITIPVEEGKYPWLSAINYGGDPSFSVYPVLLAKDTVRVDVSSFAMQVTFPVPVLVRVVYVNESEIVNM